VRAAVRCVGVGLLLAVVAACSPKPVTVTPERLQAVRWSHRAAVAAAAGHVEHAAAYSRRALAASEAAGDREGRAVALLNLATLAHQRGEREAAHTYAARARKAAEDAGGRYVADVALLQALLAFHDGDLQATSYRVEEGLDRCRAVGCGRQARFYNLRARIALRQGDPAAALARAREGIAAARQEGDRVEEGNGLRISAEAHAAAHRREAALRCYRQALALDETLERERSIARDLLGMAAQQRLAGEEAAATASLRRALVTSRRVGYHAGVEEALAALGGAEASSSTAGQPHTP